MKRQASLRVLYLVRKDRPKWETGAARWGNSDTGSLPRIPVEQGAWMTLTGFVSDELHYERELMMSANAGRSWRFIRRCWCCSEPSKESALRPAKEHEEFRKLQASGLKPHMIEFRKLKWMNRPNGR